MGKVYITSDLHIGHKNLARNLRDLDDIDKHDQMILDNINSTVNKGDTLIILGDLTMEKKQQMLDLISKIKCKTIRIVGGNHDPNLGCIDDQRVSVYGCMNYKEFILSHIPIHPACLEGCKANIHGHIHTGGPDLGEKYVNVNVEFWGYKPVDFDTIKNKYL